MADVNTTRQPCPAVSVVIPLYNAEKYIADCLESLLAQTFQNFEVIVVDDCSADSSPAIVENYREKFDGRLSLSHMRQNSGSGGLPRNKGMILSHGEYIQFLDADDMLTNTALEEMYTLAKDFDADVTYCERQYETDAKGENIHIGTRQSGDFADKPTLETENLAERIDGLLKKRFAADTCFKFVRRNFMLENEIFFPHTCPGEDNIWTQSLIFCAKRFLRVPNAIYVRRHSEGSVMRKEKTPQQTITFWLNPVLLGLKTLDELMDKHEFFQQNPKYRYVVLEKFINEKMTSLFKDSLQLQAFEVYEAIKQRFGDKLGEQAALVSALCAFLNTQQKISLIYQQKLNEVVMQSQDKIKNLNRLVEQSQNRNSNLEKQLRDSQQFIAELKARLK